MDKPTSPVSTPEIEDVFGDSDLADRHATRASTLTAEWRRIGAFLRRPTLDVGPRSAAPMNVVAQIYALDMAIMTVLVLAASIAVAMGVYLPKTALADIEFTPLVVALVVLGAPVFEELVFRSWLSGKLQHILALFAFGAGFVGFGLAHSSGLLIGVGILAAAALAAILALVLLRGRPPMRWFRAIFPVMFWLATLSFALIHLTNFEPAEGWSSLAVLLPLVLPQFVLGALLGYLRVRIGLWAAMLLHAVHNATALSIAALATLAG